MALPIVSVLLQAESHQNWCVSAGLGIKSLWRLESQLKMNLTTTSLQSEDSAPLTLRRGGLETPLFGVLIG